MTLYKVITLYWKSKHEMLSKCIEKYFRLHTQEHFCKAIFYHESRSDRKKLILRLDTDSKIYLKISSKILGYKPAVLLSHERK